MSFNYEFQYETKLSHQSGPERFQECKEEFDIILTVEEKVTSQESNTYKGVPEKHFFKKIKSTTHHALARGLV